MAQSISYQEALNIAGISIPSDSVVVTYTNKNNEIDAFEVKDKAGKVTVSGSYTARNMAISRLPCSGWQIYKSPLAR